MEVIKRNDRRMIQNTAGYCIIAILNIDVWLSDFDMAVYAGF
jgi:hypothetical protein